MLLREFTAEIKQILPNATVDEDKDGELIINSGMYLVCEDEAEDFVVVDKKPESAQP